MSTPKRKLQKILIEIKKQIIDAAAANPNKSYSNLTKEFNNDELNLTKSNVQRILNTKDSILSAVDNGIDAKRVRLTTG